MVQKAMNRLSRKVALKWEMFLWRLKHRDREIELLVTDAEAAAHYPSGTWVRVRGELFKVVKSEANRIWVQ